MTPRAARARGARSARARSPAKISTPPAISSGCSVSESSTSAKKTAKKRLKVAEQRGARRADAVDRREPEDVREEERADHGVAEAEPDLPAEVEVLGADLRDAASASGTQPIASTSALMRNGEYRRMSGAIVTV